MAIYAPGKRDRKGRKSVSHRQISSDLNLTPMIDMFTVLVVFLLQNFGTPTELLFVPKNVELPKASQVKDLAPAHLVSITNDSIVLEREVVADLKEVKEKTNWDIPNLREKLQRLISIERDKLQRGDLGKAIKETVNKSNRPPPKESSDSKGGRVTVQADKELEFITVKKVMFTVTEAGATEINFAVSKRDQPLK